ncbi:hypothetical protein VP01_2691g1 [Puccinia sorghi]|uniref:Uncharacterized protein n=1 Tax=Puccinia sorghi TaxID=27349 RepID=A0A0L6V5L2_9BASI|nr:hypothetical protein VP01_2691g1 [Puccinia sorghi]
MDIIGDWTKKSMGSSINKNTNYIDNINLKFMNSSYLTIILLCIKNNKGHLYETKGIIDMKYYCICQSSEILKTSCLDGIRTRTTQKSEKITMEHNEISFMSHLNQFGSKECPFFYNWWHQIYMRYSSMGRNVNFSLRIQLIYKVFISSLGEKMFENELNEETNVSKSNRNSRDRTFHNIQIKPSGEAAFKEHKKVNCFIYDSNTKNHYISLNGYETNNTMLVVKMGDNEFQNYRFLQLNYKVIWVISLVKMKNKASPIINSACQPHKMDYLSFYPLNNACLMCKALPIQAVQCITEVQSSKPIFLVQICHLDVCPEHQYLNKYTGIIKADLTHLSQYGILTPRIRVIKNNVLMKQGQVHEKFSAPVLLNTQNLLQSLIAPQCELFLSSFFPVSAGQPFSLWEIWKGTKIIEATHKVGPGLHLVTVLSQILCLKTSETKSVKLSC